MNLGAKKVIFLGIELEVLRKKFSVEIKTTRKDVIYITVQKKTHAELNSRKIKQKYILLHDKI